jgi:hypothetical protein
MPVTAGVVGNDRVAAVFATRHMTAERRRAAAFDRTHHLDLVEADVPGIGPTPCRPVVAEDIRDLQRWTGHGRAGRYASGMVFLPGLLARLRQQVEGALNASAAGGPAFLLVHRARLIASAERERLPAVYWSPLYVKEGGLLSYGVNPATQFANAATYIDRILKGAKPGNLPVQAPTKFELVINLKTARALGLTIPEKVIATADEVIE